MAKVTIDEETLNGIGRAIISKHGASAPLKPGEMAEAIASIPSGGWTRPSDWPDIVSILAGNEIASQYSHKMILLLDKGATGVSVGWTDYNVGDVLCIKDESPTEYGIVQKMRSKQTIPLSVRDGYRWVIFAWDGKFGASFIGSDRSSLWAYCDNAKFVNIHNSGGTSPYGPFLESHFSEVGGTISTSEHTSASGMFYNCIELSSVPDVIDISGYTSTYRMFCSCYSLTAVPPVLDLSSVTAANEMFLSCYSLDKVPDVLDLSRVTNAQSLFSDCYNLRKVPDVLDLSSATNVSNMFQRCFNLRKVPDILDLSSATNVVNMFYNCANLRSVPDVLDLSSATNVANMFYNCTSLRSVPDVLDLSSATNVSNMFYYCHALKRLPTHVTCNLSLSFSSSTDVDEPDSVASFDANGDINGGFVGNLNTCPNSGQTITFNSSIKNLFSADQWSAIKATLADKNWGCSPA